MKNLLEQRNVGLLFTMICFVFDSLGQVKWNFNLSITNNAW
jgi:hypothetical protein